MVGECFLGCFVGEGVEECVWKLVGGVVRWFSRDKEFFCYYFRVREGWVLF